MTANKMPEMPERPFSPFLVREQMGPEAFNCRSWTAYPPEQLMEIEAACAELGFSSGFDAGYLAGIAAAKECVPGQKDRQPGYGLGLVYGDEVIANLSALEQGVGK